VLEDNSMALAIPAGLGVGLAIGMVNGVVTTKIRIPSFLVTLGTFSIISGIARAVTDLQAVPILNNAYNSSFGSGNIGSISTLFLWTGGALLVGHVVYRHTRFGRHLLATGGNKQAAIEVGIRTNRIKVLALVIAAVCASIAGMLYAGRLHGARYTFGEDDLLTVIAAVVIGGTSLFGGRGSITGAVVGSLLLGVLNNGLILMGLDVPQQMEAQGVIILLAVALSLREART
jgi:ribose transport system permease protein